MLRLVGLDLDGTLVDSAPDLAHALGVALAAEGHAPPGEQRTREWIGDGIEALIRRALEAAAGTPPGNVLVARTLERFDATYDRELFSRSRVYAGVPECLDRLGARGLVLACITNKRLAFAERLLDRAGLRDRLDIVLGGDSFAGRKPHPEQLLAAADRVRCAPAQAVMVGDGANDYLAAGAAGFEFVWAAYGYTTSIEALGVTPPLRIDRFPDVEAILAEL